MERAWKGILRSQAVVNGYVLKASVIEVDFKQVAYQIHDH